MKNTDILQIIIYTVCGLACAGLGIYYFLTENSTNGAIFLVVGAVSVVLAVRMLIKFLKNRKNGGDKEE